MSSSRTDYTFEDVLAYVKTVRLVFEDKIGKFDEFVRLIRDYEARRIDLEAVKEGAIELFEEHKDLLSRFNIFLPGNEISLPLDDEQQGDDDELAVQDEKQGDDEQKDNDQQGVDDAFAAKNEQKGDGQQGDGDTLAVKDVEQQGDGKDVEQQGVPRNSKMLTLRFIPMPIRNQPNFTIRNIHSGTKVSDMKKFLELHVRNAVPRDGKFFFIHNRRVMYENLSFEMHDARTGDRIELFDGVIIAGDD